MGPKFGEWTLYFGLEIATDINKSVSTSKYILSVEDGYKARCSLSTFRLDQCT